MIPQLNAFKPFNISTKLDHRDHKFAKLFNLQVIFILLFLFLTLISINVILKLIKYVRSQPLYCICFEP